MQVLAEIDWRQDSRVSLGVAAVLVVTGGVFLWRHRVGWRKQQSDPSHDAADQRYFSRRYRRRMQTSSLLIVIGVLIGIGDPLIPWQKLPGLFAIYWGGVLLLACWVILQAVSDLSSTRMHSRQSLADLRRKQAELRQELGRVLEERSGSNGRGPNGSARRN